MSLTRKKVRVKAKSGKIYTRNMMVRGSGPVNRRGLAAMNPWSPSHTEHVSTNSALGERAKFYGSAGPGSSHSLFAHIVGATKQQRLAGLELHRDHPYNEQGGRSGGGHHAAIRQIAGYQAVRYGSRESAGLIRGFGGTGHADIARERRNLKAAFGTRSVFHVPQDPGKWVR